MPNFKLRKLWPRFTSSQFDQFGIYNPEYSSEYPVGNLVQYKSADESNRDMAKKVKKTSNDASYEFAVQPKGTRGFLDVGLFNKISGSIPKPKPSIVRDTLRQLAEKFPSADYVVVSRPFTDEQLLPYRRSKRTVASEQDVDFEGVTPKLVDASTSVVGKEAMSLKKYLRKNARSQFGKHKFDLTRFRR